MPRPEKYPEGPTRPISVTLPITVVDMIDQHINGLDLNRSEYIYHLVADANPILEENQATRLKNALEQLDAAKARISELEAQIEEKREETTYDEPMSFWRDKQGNVTLLGPTREVG